nr:MAG TPA: hypothetical protein [Caudoviricetes sp.]
MTYIKDWIDIKELRFGNYVSFTDPSGETSNMIVGGVMPDEILLWFPPNVSSGDKVEVSNGITIRGWQDGPEINPIPLTKELLLKCGFEEEFGGIIYYNRNQGIEFNFSNGWCTASRGEYDIVDVQYLHQLQNLYFALTGEELEVNF